MEVVSDTPSALRAADGGLTRSRSEMSHAVSERSRASGTFFADYGEEAQIPAPVWRRGRHTLRGIFVRYSGFSLQQLTRRMGWVDRHESPEQGIQVGSRMI